MNKKNLKLLAIGLAILFVSSGITAYFILTEGNKKTASDATRVACVGNSITQSSGYPYELWKLLGSEANYTFGNYSLGPDEDSSTLGSDVRYEVGNFGAGSTTVILNTETPYMNTSVFQSALEFQPNIVIIMLGTNDAQPNLHQYNTSFVEDYLMLVAAFQGLSSKPKIWIVLPPPIFSDQGGKISPEYFEFTVIPCIEQAANETNLPIIDVYSALASYSNYFPDGLHPNSEGAKLIADEIYKAIIAENTGKVAP
jgi:lysophospholipase L1-like esterase